MSADQELNQVLVRRQEINDALDNGHEMKIKYRVVNVYTEFHEFTRKEIKSYESTFKKFNTNKDSYLSIDELKRMMEVLGAPQTHLGLKAMIKEVDEDGDGRLSFHEFMLVFRKARAGELEENSGLAQLAKLTEIDVDKVGVNGAKEFFEAKIKFLKAVGGHDSKDWTYRMMKSIMTDSLAEACSLTGKNNMKILELLYREVNQKISCTLKEFEVYVAELLRHAHLTKIRRDKK